MALKKREGRRSSPSDNLHLTFHSKLPGDTQKAGAELGKTLAEGDLVLLFGDIGAGKTVFVSGIAESLGVNGPVTSPTYTLANTYDCCPPLYHLDAFRIDSPDELAETGYFDFVGVHGIYAVEWAENLCGMYPKKRVEVRINFSPESDLARIINIDHFDA